jgi:L-serine dehydratase
VVQTKILIFNYFFRIFVKIIISNKYQMQSVKKNFKTGQGPSSSHTMGPHRAAIEFQNKYPNSNNYKATLYGSLALTGKGHLTDKAILDVFTSELCEII